MLFVSAIGGTDFFNKSLAEDVWHKYLKTVFWKPYPLNTTWKLFYLCAFIS